MFRTRDFMLVLSAVVFLIVAIGTTLSARGGYSSLISAMNIKATEDVDYTAVVYSSDSTPSREDRLATMRSKIAAGEALTLSAPEPVVEESDLSEVSIEPVVDESATVVAGLQQCANYSAYAGVWSPQGVQFEVIEGARMVFREGQTMDAAVPPVRETLLQLPMYSAPTKNRTNCISSDVVGVAQDGSLIRNEEAGMYRVFGEGTLVGYALDGFPIYGASQTATDACGGALVAGQYRYLLSAERETVLNCFSATPISL
jgi:hypothetical protein